MATTGISGVAVGTITAGGFLVYTGIANVKIQDGLRQIMSGKAITPGPQGSTDLSAPGLGAAAGAANSNGLGAAAGAANAAPAGPALTKFLWSLGVQESGGNYSAHNSIGALGKYQVMTANVAGWSKEALGHSITPQQFLSSPQLQEQIVSYKINQYFTQFGGDWRKVAAAWYAGPGNANLYGSTKSQPGGPSIAGYVNSVVGRAGL